MAGLLLVACTPSRLEKALSFARSNKTELERVIAHYDSIGDEEKVRAAEWLISNMPGCHYYEGKVLEDFYKELNNVYDTCGGDFVKVWDFYDATLEKVNWRAAKRKRDIETITAEYLIRNIDGAFEHRESPFLRDLSFEEFCETMLPHRVSNEPLEDWRKDYGERFAFAMDSVDVREDSVVFKVFKRLTNTYVGHNYTYPAGMPTLPPSLLRRSLIAPCSDYCALGVLWGRTFGVPVVRDFTPHWVNYPNKHEWNAVLWKGRSLDFLIGDKYGLGEHLNKFDLIMTKVYRQRYAPQGMEDVAPAYYKGDVPQFFRNPKMVDVTREYWTVMDLKVDSLNDKDAGPFVYLTVFNNQDWEAIAWAEKKGERATFKDVAVRPAVYLPAYYESGTYGPAHEPIMVMKNGEVRTLRADVEHRRSVTLKRKYYEKKVNGHLKDLAGSTIQVANRADFGDARSFVVPDTIEVCWQEWNISGRYRYVRIKPAKGRQTGLAELRALDTEGKAIGGTLIGNSEIKGLYAPEHVIDGDVLTCTRFEKCDSDRWIGVDMGKSQNISKVEYLPRNDDNFIVEGNEYELYYWDGGWQSLGRQTGSRRTQRLVYDNVPSNALLLLHNHTRGREERIFTYEDDRQVWW